MGGQVEHAQRDPPLAAAAFPASLGSGMLDEDPSHGLGRRAVEVTAIGPLDVHLADESGVCLVHQGGRLERVVGALVPHSLLRNGSELLVDQRQDLLGRAGFGRRA
jgi:hypothetical protein